ncbi:hypothetical protein WJ438_15625 [Streptomyces sp. GD-15H]|uniref:hypothetical protein n=1 Tax=Streptomyces sp. GD-15H TaxID=3129112 RepID=UPI00324BA029
MDEREELRLEEILSAVHRLVAPSTGDLACEAPGHRAGRTCLASSAAISFPWVVSYGNGDRQ